MTIEQLEQQIEHLSGLAELPDLDHARLVVAALRDALTTRRRPRRRTGSGVADRLARERVGEARHPARLPRGAHRGRAAGERARSRSPTRTRCRSPTRIPPAASGSSLAGRRSATALHRPARRLHAADVREHRRVRRRRQPDRFARAGRLVRAGRQARAPERGRADWRRPRARRLRCRSSSKTTCSSAATAASTKAPSCGAAPCWPRERSSPARPRSTTWCASGFSRLSQEGRSWCRKARWLSPDRGG